MHIILVPLVTAVITSVATILVGKLTGIISDRRNEDEAIKEGLRTLLRNELVAAHKEWCQEQGHITLEALEFCEQTYGAYHGLGGNGSGDKLWHDIKTLPIKE